MAGLRIRLGARTASWSVFVSGPRIEKVRIGLGPWSQISVTEARQRAESVWNDYRAARDNELEDDVVDGLLEHYAKERLVALRTGAETLRALRVGFASLLLRYPWAIQQTDIQGEIRRLAQSAPQQANRTLAYAKTLFSWAIEKGYVKRSPAANITRPAPASSRSRMLSPIEIAMLWYASDEISSRDFNYPFGYVVKLLLLTGLRTNLIAEMQIQDLVLPADTDDGFWIMSGAHANCYTPLSFHLRPVTRKLIEEAMVFRLGNSRYLFATVDDRPVSGWSSTKLAIDGVLADAELDPWRFDDIRRTYATFSASVPDGAQPHDEWADTVEGWILEHSTLQDGRAFLSHRSKRLIGQLLSNPA